MSLSFPSRIYREENERLTIGNQQNETRLMAEYHQFMK